MQADIDNYFAQVLKRLREDRQITQEELAFNAQLDRTYISMLERGLRKPSLESVFSIAKALGMKVTAIISEVEKLVDANQKSYK